MSLRAKRIEAAVQELVKEGLLTEDQLSVALETQKNLGGELDEILIQRGFVTEKELLKKLGKKYGLPILSLKAYNPDANILKILTPEQAAKWQIIPLFEVEDKITIATTDPFDLTLLDEIHAELGKDIDCVLSSTTEMEKAIKKYYGGAVQSTREKGPEVQVVQFEMSPEEGATSAIVQIEREARAEKVVSAVDHILKQAFHERASDIHLEPTRTDLKIRIRVDGVLMELKSLPKTIHQPTISRIKILGNMDVAERRLPQDGRVRIRILGNEIDLRIATYPTIFGEAAAIRLLSKEQLINLHDIGLSERDKKMFERLILSSHGIILVTGPTGSGKTTTLYAALLTIDRKNRHVLSVEDPVEHEIPDVSQTQVNIKAGVTFASVLRSMLREDPDIIMVGEIRDRETSDISFRAAMTGHLVFSTLHTNSAAGAIARLIDLGVEPFLISNTTLGVLAQRLVRKICPHCKEETEPTKQQQNAFGPKGAGLRAFKGKGCKECRMTGYRGRTGIFEMIHLDDEMRVLINNRAPEVRIREKAKTSGSLSLLEDGIEKIRDGVTSVDEVLRVTAQT